MFLCQYFLTKGVSDFVFSFFCPCQRSGCCFFFLYFLVVFLFFLSTRWSPTQPNSTRLDSIRLQTQTPAFILASSWTGGPGRQAALLPLPFAAIVISLITKWGVDLQGECGAVRCSGVESSRMEWSGVLERWGLQLGTGKWAAVWNIFHLARWLTGWAAASAMEPPFLPRNPHISSHPSRNPTDNGKPQVLLFLFFFFIVFLLVVWFGLVGWLVGCLPGWLTADWKYFLLPLLLLGVLILFPVIKSQSREVS